jgi:DNA-binding HxlR family transcriptional regulator
MLKRDYEGQESCSVARTLEIVGERWTWLIIRDAFLGLTRFAEFQASLGIARNVLAERLNRLADEGIFERVLYNAHPPRYEYLLTQKGRDLFTALNAIRQWGDQYLSAKPMRLLRLKADQTPVVAALVPEGTPVPAPDEIELVPGPGFPRADGRGRSR